MNVRADNAKARGMSDAEGAAANGLFSRLSPQWVMGFALLLGIVGCWAAVVLVVQGPWLGVELAADANGVRVVSVVPGGPADGRIATGDRWVALRTEHGETLAIDGNSLMDDPDVYPTYDEYNRFYAGQSGLLRALSAPSVRVVSDDGREIVIEPAAKRPLRNVPSEFWTLSIFSTLMFQVGMGIWAFRRGQMDIFLVALSSFGYMLAGITIAVYSVREWVMEPQLFQWLNLLNHLGYMLYGYAALVLLWHYPRPLGRFPMVAAFLLAVALVWFNEVFQGSSGRCTPFSCNTFFPSRLA